MPPYPVLICPLIRLLKPSFLSSVSVPHELLWTIIGLLLTIGGTFIKAFTTNPPWLWFNQGVQLQSLDVSYQIGAVLFTGCLGGKNAGALSQIAYVVIGLLLLPVFSQGGGWDYVKEPSFGYILGFIPGAWVCGWLAFRDRAKIESLAWSSIVGLLVIHLTGIIYLIGLSYLTIKPLALAIIWQEILHYSVLVFPAHLILVCTVSAFAYIFRQVLFY